MRGENGVKSRLALDNYAIHIRHCNERDIIGVLGVHIQLGNCVAQCRHCSMLRESGSEVDILL